MKIIEYVYFTGEEDEKEFLKKLVLQWEKISDCDSDIQKLLVVGSMIHEIRHRIDELE